MGRPPYPPELGQLDALVWSAGICKLAPGMMLNEKPLTTNIGGQSGSTAACD
jgi:hypothetical protein